MKRRSKTGLTDYAHRFRMLARHTPVSHCYDKDARIIYRVVLGKKNRYTYLGLYHTPAFNMPDDCLYYGDTRRIEPDVLVKNFVHAITGKIRTGGMLVLDLGRHKKLRTNPLGASLIKAMAEANVGPVRGLRP